MTAPLEELTMHRRRIRTRKKAFRLFPGFRGTPCTLAMTCAKVAVGPIGDAGTRESKVPTSILFKKIFPSWEREEIGLFRAGSGKQKGGMWSMFRCICRDGKWKSCHSRRLPRSDLQRAFDRRHGRPPVARHDAARRLLQCADVRAEEILICKESICSAILVAAHFRG